MPKCPNVKCQKPISTSHTDEWCHHCGEYFSEEFKVHLPRVPREVGTANIPVDPLSSSVQSRLSTRYADAYLLARASDVLGIGIKIGGVALGAIIAIAGFSAASTFGSEVGFGAFLLGTVVALPIYVLGVLVSAQGQVLKATLDTAVNTSPLLSSGEIRKILAV